jgi:2-isopropylmalate synthase
VHCHDDFGCATANSLQGVLSGARQIECSLYNIGERAGNTALEEVVMAIRKRQDYYPCDTRIDTRLFWEAARLVEHITQVGIPPNKAVVGKNAFSHESGIHQAGVLKNRAAYEIMHPEEVGWKGRSIMLGPQSGRNGLRSVLVELGIQLDTNQFEEAYRLFVAHADQSGQVSPDTLRSIVAPLRVSDVA